MHESASAVLRPGDWFACTFPERPHDAAHTWYDDNCRACVVALGAMAHLHCQEDIIGYDRRGQQVDVSTCRAVYDVARTKHGLPPLPEEVVT